MRNLFLALTIGLCYAASAFQPFSFHDIAFVGAAGSTSQSGAQFYFEPNNDPGTFWHGMSFGVFSDSYVGNYNIIGPTSLVVRVSTLDLMYFQFQDGSTLKSIVAPNLNLNGIRGLELIDFPSLEQIQFPSVTNATLDITFNASLRTVDFSGWTRTTGLIALNNNALSQATVDNVLDRLANIGFSGTVRLWNGTSSQPSAAGYTDKTTIEGFGGTVSVNGTDGTLTDLSLIVPEDNGIQFEWLPSGSHTGAWPKIGFFNYYQNQNGTITGPTNIICTITNLGALDWQPLWSDTVKSIRLTNMVSTASYFWIGSFTNLTEVSIPVFTTPGTGFFRITDNPSLVTFDFPSTWTKTTGTVGLTGNAFNETSVDDVLVTLDGALFQGTVHLTGGTMSTPSAAGLTAKTNIVARGGTVTHN